MIKIQWDDTLPSNKAPDEIQRWDEWFEIVDHSLEWSIVKELFPGDVNKQLTWAYIIEMNRINSVSMPMRDRAETEAMYGR